MSTNYLFASALVFFNVIGLNATEYKDNQKIYVSSDKICLDNNSILVNLGINWIVVDRLCSDENGYYVSSNAFFDWECSRCGAKNSVWEKYCWICGKKR